VKILEINKFPPSLFRRGRFLREDWTSCTDIGTVTPNGILSKEEYLRVEGLYVSAVMALARISEPEVLRAHDVEFWENESSSLANLGLDDILDTSSMPAEGEPVTGHRLENVVRRCLREVAWLELEAAPRLLVHFGYDMRIVIASTLDLTSALDEIRSRGLFVYDSAASLPTLKGWIEQ
jgi:hypothetical protein